MSDLNINILVQSIENLSQQVVKSESATKQDNASLTKAKALLDGLKGMFGIQAITLEAAGDMVDVTMTVLDNKVHFILDPAQELKLCDVKIIDSAGNEVDAEDVVRGSVVLEQPNDIRQAMLLVSDKLSTLSQ